MALTLHFHPLSSFCWKALIALYENDTPFTPNQVNLGDPIERAALVKLWPIGKFPVLTDDVRQAAVAESSIIIEYLDRHYPGQTRFLSADPNLALDTRLRDRFFDLYVHLPMQKIVGDRLRPADKKDPLGVEQARAQLGGALDMVEADMAGKTGATKTWAMGDAFTMADCAAAPALYYANRVMPFADSHKNATAYLARLTGRPSFAHTLREAEPYRHLFPT
ncbi:MAG: glutathione S-transferase family protein [Terriglobia bacterium]